MTSLICSKCHSQISVDQAVAKSLERCPICGGAFADTKFRPFGQSHRFQVTTAAPADPTAVVDHLKVEAEHKADLKMFYAGADVLRDYHGPFERETSSAREKLAQEFEERGHVAERERLAHGPLFTQATEERRPATPHVSTHSYVHSPVSQTHQTTGEHPAPAVHKQIRKCRECHRMIVEEHAPCPYCKKRHALQQRVLILTVGLGVVVILAALVHSLMNPPVNQAQLQAFNQSIAAGNLVGATRFIAANPALVNAATHSGQTPMGNAVDAGNVAMVDLLLARGANINATGLQCLTPLMQAVENADYKMVACLLQHGADVHRAECQHGLTALHLVGSEDNKAGVPIAELLVSYGASVNEKSGDGLGVTPLACCASSKSDVADFLRNKGGRL